MTSEIIFLYTWLCNYCVEPQKEYYTQICAVSDYLNYNK